MYKKSKGSNFMKKNKSQLSTKQNKKLQRKLKFYNWVIQTFTKENVMAAVCGISAGIAASHLLISFTCNNLLGGFGFLFLLLWVICTWTGFVNRTQENKEEIKEVKQLLKDLGDKLK